ncbi:MAG: GSCFA domain-containing protein [Bacteroidota bacterium]|nr:GSCFA domain-containing protein [Bacteroidota bacterium]
MKQFRTEVKVPEFDWKASYQSRLIFLGSCFTNHIGERMQELKFQTNVNPFGIIYNPASVKSSLEKLITNESFQEEDLNFHNDRWYSFYHHTSFSHHDKKLCLDRINQKIQDSSKFLKKADFLFISLGTARVYELAERSQVVSNCHKLPSKLFNYRLLSSEEIADNYEKLINSLVRFNPGLKIIFTLSPIRHWKDGATGNQLSKAILLVAIHRLVNIFPNAEYFPSYELMMDDLRDYRFYAEDMIHISPAAVDYIWDKFQKVLLDKSAINLVPKIENILKAVKHKPFDPSSESYKSFQAQVLKNIEELQKQYPFLDFSEEKNQLLREV